MAADLDPSTHRVLLVGPRVVPLKGMFDRRGYRVVAAANGVEGMAQLDTDPCDLVILELNLGDLTATEFLMAARQGSPKATFLLVDEAGRAGQIVKALQAGLDGFLAAPADEDRLFYEVERHLRRVGAPSTGAAAEAAANHDASGFEENSTQTQMTTVEATRAAADGRDAQALLEKANTALTTLRADNEHLAAEARRLGEVQGVLQGHLEGLLDADEAMRLRERLGLAQVAEIELLTLRGDVQSMKASRKEQDQRIEELQRELRLARAAIEAANIAATATGGFAEPPPTEMGRAAELEARLADLEQDVVRWERRNRDLEATLTAAKQALSNAEEESETAVLEVKAAARADLDAARADLAVARAGKELLDEQVGLLQAELARVGTVDVSLKETRAELERVRAALVAAEASASMAVARAAEDDIRQSAANEEAIAIAVDGERARLEERFAAERAQAVKEAVAAERARLEREQTSALEVAMNAASSAAADKAKAALEKALVAEREKAGEREKAAVAAAVASTRAAVRHEIESAAAKKIADAVDQARASRERADDIELQLEEARTRVEFLEMDAARVTAQADERVAAAEAAFKREKVRLVEEKQAAASGSQEAILHMDALREEAAAARRLAEEADAARAEATATAEAAVLAREDAEGELRGLREERDRERDRARAALDTVERLEAAYGALQGHARDVEARLAAAEAAEAAADARAAVAVEAGEAAAAEVEERADILVRSAREHIEAEALARVDAVRAEADVRVDAARAEADVRVDAAVTEAEARVAAAVDAARIEAEARVAAAVETARLEAEARVAAALEAAAVEAEARLQLARDEAAAAAAAVDVAEKRRVADLARLEEELLEVKARAAVDADNAAREAVTSSERQASDLIAAEARARAAAEAVAERDQTLAMAIAGLAAAKQAGSELTAALTAAKATLAEKDAALARAAQALETERVTHGVEQARLESALEAARTAALAQANASDAAEALAAARVDADARVAAAEQERQAIERRLTIADGARGTAEAAAADADRRRAALEAKLADVEARLAAAQGAVDDGAADKLAAAVQQVAAAEAARAAAVADIAHIQAEASLAHEQALRAVGELQEQLNTLEEERGGWQAEKARLTSQILGLQDKAAKAAQVNGHAQEGHLQALSQRVAELEGQLSQVDPGMVATVRSLVDAVDPLRWGLGAAIDYLYPFEGNDQSLATHVRNLRLLSATLARLVAETGARPGTG